MTATLRYVPADPGGVVSVDRMRLYALPARTGVPLVDTTATTAQADGSWLIAMTEQSAGTYYARTTVSYTDGPTLEDNNDTVTFPLVTAAQPGDPIAPWVTVGALQADPRLSGLTEAILILAAQAATEVLWGLSGRQFGGLRTSDVLVLPPACGCDHARIGRSDMWGGASSALGGIGGSWPFGWIFGCACRAEVALPDRPVTGIVRVSIDGVTVAPAGYRLDDNATLVRVDGAYWPLTGSGLADTARPRMRVVYLWGLTPPAAGVLAAQTYATEIALAAAGSSDCRLPDRVTRITRQDVEKTFADPTVLVEKGLTGLTTVDVWTHSVNPRGHSGTKPRVLTPDLPRMRRTS